MSALEIMLEKAYDEDKKDSEADRTINRTKRALWLARAERAKDKASLFKSLHYKKVVNIYGIIEEPPFRFCKNRLRFSEDWIGIFLAVERKCRAYADKFKEET